MDRLKGLLNRSDSTEGELLPMTTAMEESEFARDRAPKRSFSFFNRAPPPLDNVTMDLLMDKIIALTREKAALKTSEASLQAQLERANAEKMNLQFTCADLSNTLKLQELRLQNQVEFFQQQILRQNRPSSLGVEAENNDPRGSDRLQMEQLMHLNKSYEETIKGLMVERDAQTKKIFTLKNDYEEKMKARQLEHEQYVSRILENASEQMLHLTWEHEATIQEMLSGYEEFFEELRAEFEDMEEEEADEETQKSLLQQIIDEFNALPTSIKIVAAAGLIVLGAAFAWASWTFIIYLWPQLLKIAKILAENLETALLATTILEFFNSPPFQTFTQSWKDGQPLGECLNVFANTDFFKFATQLGPNIFTQLKNLRQSIVAI